MIYQLNDEYFVRTPKESDLDGPYLSWFEDQEVCRYNSHGKLFKTIAAFREYFTGLNSDKKMVWAIAHRVDGHIGNISLQSISWINRQAEFAILLGDKRHWGKRVATKAGKMILHHGFSKLNLNRVYLGTAATNQGMRKLAETMGMTQEGCRRSHLYLNGEWVDVIDYGILKNEFKY